MHLLHAACEQLGGAIALACEVTAAAHQIRGRRRQRFVIAAIRHDETLLGIFACAPEVTPNVGDAAEPVQHAGLTRFIVQSVRERKRSLEVLLILYTCLTGARYASELHRRIDFGALSIRLLRERSGEMERLLVKGCGLGVGKHSSRLISGRQRIRDRTFSVSALGEMTSEGRRFLAAAQCFHHMADRNMQCLSAPGE